VALDECADLVELRGFLAQELGMGDDPNDLSLEREAVGGEAAPSDADLIPGAGLLCARPEPLARARELLSKARKAGEVD